MTWAQRVLEHFVAPTGDPCSAGPGEDPEEARAVPHQRTPPGVALLCTAGDASALGSALGLLLARRHHASAVAVCAWTGGSGAGSSHWRAPAFPAARRLAGTLSARGLDASAGGRLAAVRLPASGEEASTEARRALVAAAAAGCPSVLVLAGPRAAPFDALLAEQDLVVVAARSGAAPALARLAIDGLASEAVCACACDVPPAPPARALAEAGLLLLPSARRALAGPIGAMS